MKYETDTYYYRKLYSNCTEGWIYLKGKREREREIDRY